MSHSHHYDIDNLTGIGTCRWTACPERKKQHQHTWLSPAEQGYSFGSTTYKYAQMARRVASAAEWGIE